MRSQTYLTKINRDQDKVLGQLSTGERINRAADDAAGLAISEKMTSVIRSFKMAGRNAVDGISVAQVAESGLMESSELLIRMKELAIQAASDTIGPKERTLANQEYQQLKSEIERVAQVTEFNGQKLLSGSSKVLDIQVGGHGKEDSNRISIALDELHSGAGALGISSGHILSKDGARSSLGTISSALEKVVSKRTILGSLQVALTATSQNTAVYDQNLSASNSRIKDTDFAQAASELARTKILSDANTSVAVQTKSLGKGILDLL